MRRSQTIIWNNYYLLCNLLLETERLLRPFFLLADNTFRPLAVDIRSRKPCLFLRFLLEGWNVLFIFLFVLFLGSSRKRTAKIGFFSISQKLY